MRQLFPCLPRLNSVRFAAGQNAWLAAVCLVVWSGTVCAQQPPRGPLGPPRQPGPPASPPAGQTPVKEEEAVDPNGLPADYTPPPQVPEIMLLDEPLLNAADHENWKKNRVKYQQVLRNGANSEADRKLVLEGLRYRLYLMTEKDHRRDLHNLRLDLTSTDLNMTGRIIQKAPDVKTFRQFVLEQIVRLTEPLLKNNFYVRLQAATLLGELDLMVDDTVRGLKHETYTPACELLIKVLDDPEQPTPVKIAAARSIIRLVRFGSTGNPPVELRHRIATSTLAELAKPDTHYWYQMRLAEVLSTLDVSFDLQNRKPFVVNGLLAIVRDPKRDFRARAEAARALGRVPLDPQVDIPGLIRDLMKFAEELAVAAQQDPSQPQWKQCFFNLYLAFRPQDQEADKEATKKSPAGLLNNNLAATSAQQIYKLIVPLVTTVLNDKPVSVPDVQAIQEWVKQNTPNAVGAAKPPDAVGAPQTAEAK